VRAESVPLRTYPLEEGESLQTWVHVARTDVTPSCGLLANFRSLIERPRIDAGMDFRIASRFVFGGNEYGSSVLNAVSTESGELLYASATLASVPTFVEEFGHLVPGLQVAVEGKSLCTDVSGRKSLRASFSVGSDTCSVDAQTSRCCSLWGRNYEIEVMYAFASLETNQVEIAFALRAEGLYPFGQQRS